jgi:hypothetical protein
VTARGCSACTIRQRFCGPSVAAAACIQQFAHLLVCLVKLLHLLQQPVQALLNLLQLLPPRITASPFTAAAVCQGLLQLLLQLLCLNSCLLAQLV